MDEKTIREEALKLLPSILQLEVQRILREESGGVAIESVDQVLGADPEAISRVSSACVDYVMAIEKAARKSKMVQEALRIPPNTTSSPLGVGPSRDERISLAEITGDAAFRRASLGPSTIPVFPTEEIRSSYLGYLNTLNTRVDPGQIFIRNDDTAALTVGGITSSRTHSNLTAEIPLPGFPDPE